MKYILFIGIFGLFCSGAYSQSVYGKIEGNLVEARTKQPIPFATISLFNNQSDTAFSQQLSDINGNFTFDSLKQGKYSIDFEFVGYKKTIISDINVQSGMITFVNNTSLKVDTNIMIIDYFYLPYRIPLINKDGFDGETFQSKDLHNMAGF